MARVLRMPEISANTAEAVLSGWPLAEHTAFRSGDAIATVETEKAIVDVPADADGVLLRTLVAPGSAVEVGTPIAVLGTPGEVVDDLDALVESLTGLPAGTGATLDPATAAAGVPAAPSGTPLAPAGNGAELAAAAGAPAGETTRTFASPLARRLAREHGLPVDIIVGTGPGGRIVRDDVRRAIAARQQPASPAPAMSPVPAAGPAGVPADYEDVPHSRMRRAIANRLVSSIREAPHFAIRASARVDALLALRQQLNAGGEVKVSVNDLIVAAAGRAHLAVPQLNAIWTPDAIRRYERVDIGLAVATDTGLVTPIVRDVPGLTISALARTRADLVARAHAGALRQDEIEGGTLTVTNLGMFGTEDFTAVINPPQAAILAVGAARPEAVVTDGQLGIATVLRVTLSVDHRPVDGATAAQWMAAFQALLEAPLRVLA